MNGSKDVSIKSEGVPGAGCYCPHLLSKFKVPHTLRNTEEIKNTTHANDNRLTGVPATVTSALCGPRCPT